MKTAVVDVEEDARVELADPFLGGHLLSRQAPGTDAGRIFLKMVEEGVGVEPTDLSIGRSFSRRVHGTDA